MKLIKYTLFECFTGKILAWKGRYFFGIPQSY